MMTADDLRSWRVRRNETQVQAALALGISLRQYKNLELGASPVTLTQEKLIRCLEARARAEQS